MHYEDKALVRISPVPNNAEIDTLLPNHRLFSVDFMTRSAGSGNAWAMGERPGLLHMVEETGPERGERRCPKCLEARSPDSELGLSPPHPTAVCLHMAKLLDPEGTEPMTRPKENEAGRILVSQSCGRPSLRARILSSRAEHWPYSQETLRKVGSATRLFHLPSGAW